MKIEINPSGMHIVWDRIDGPYLITPSGDERFIVDKPNSKEGWSQIDINSDGDVVMWSPGMDDVEL